MKLQTSIQPRRDGTVRVLGQDRQTYVFVAGPDGELTCDVPDEATVAFLLKNQNFWPADPADAEAALDLIKSQAPEIKGDAEGDADDEEESNPDALPVEANTPPAPRRGRRKAQ